MRPQVKFLTDQDVKTMIQEGIALLQDPGIQVHNEDALNYLAEAGAQVNLRSSVVRIPEKLVDDALASVPSEFKLYDLNGEEAVHYGGDRVYYDPGSAALTILDPDTLQHRLPATGDFVNFVKLVEMLPQIDAQSTAMVPGDVPEDVGDFYRLYLALNFMTKPIITGAFRVDTWWTMKELLTTVAGGEKALREKPIAVFDVCPSPPLKWSNLTCQNMIDCARHGIPSEMVSMPLAGATAPATLAGSVVQHTAECLSGVVICQLAAPGAPIVWGGSPAVFDMRQGTTPMGAVGTWMMDCAYTQVGKALNMPTHAYLGMSDAKVIDVQCGLESSGGALLAALAGVNMVSGAGMLAFENCQSLEKLVVDAEIIGMAKHLIKGIIIRDEPIALPLMRELGHDSEFLSHDHTFRWFREEQYIPSEIIDRQPAEAWESSSLSAWERAKNRVQYLIKDYPPSPLPSETRKELFRITSRAAREFGMDHLPELTGLETF